LSTLLIPVLSFFLVVSRSSPLLFPKSRSFLLSLTYPHPCIPLNFQLSCFSPLGTPPYSLLSSLFRDIFLNLRGKATWMRDHFIARPLQSVQYVSSFGILCCSGVLNPHKDKWQHDSLDGGSHHHKASNSTRQHINLSTNNHVPREFLIVSTVCKRWKRCEPYTAESPGSDMCVSTKRAEPNAQNTRKRDKICFVFKTMNMDKLLYK
jgi:hypothetical protein